MLNITNIEFELISNADMYLFFKKGMGGRVFYFYKRYFKANNKYFNS